MDVPIPVLLLLIVGALLWSSCRGQQSYQESDLQGYTCSPNSGACSAYATYRAPQGETLVSVGLRFGLSAEQVAGASQIPTGSSLTPGQLLLIPLNCSCASGRSQYNVSYVIQKGDTFYLVSNNTFQGLTTYQAVERANPAFEPTKLEPGDKITFPIRCACPTSQQAARGVKYLVTYSVLPNDSLEKIASDWNVSQSSVGSENTVSGSGAAVKDADLQAFTTLLLPVTQDPPQPPKQTALTPSSNAPAPAPPVTPPPAPTSSSSSNNTAAFVGIGVGCAAALGILVLGGVFYRKKTRKLKKSSRRHPSKASSYGTNTATTGSIIKDEEREFGTFSSSMSSAGFMNNSKEHHHDILVAGMNDLVDSEKPVLFSYEELRDATNNFSPSHLIQGSMYRGVLRKQLVAIKEMKGGTTSQELKILCKVHHSNLVRLVGVCSGADHLFLVYEYAENGSLSSCLHNKTPADFKVQEGRAASDSAASSSAFLSWNARLQIALDVATGLEYIHDYTKPSFVHKDIKSSNILLDSSLRAKIANFGMARLASDTALTKHIAGTQGYMAPEYLTHGFVSTKVDVYAFGVVLLELLTGREAILGSGQDKQYLAEVFTKLVDDLSDDDNNQKIEKLKPWVDPVLENVFPWDIVLSFVALARSCVDADPDARPNMKELTYKLSKLLDSSMEWETTAVLNRRYNSAPLEGR